ncbi:dynein light chain [Tritrichomonas foetus]|uniref:Dynein light chain n=1 Tax=Tritrichomonas foetus TaxID=1144522 RepID=A0A1J4JDN5_9EUKA|nr:dynein light chain [Tritrichomonas foetus]|eukprot:OHS95549.1 dynein light chain [Tritrichomonas foetus]
MPGKKVPTMTANQALQAWAQAHPDQRLEEVEEIYLQFQTPPIKVMSDKLAQLANCKKLSISTNNIEEISFLPPRIEILAIGRNMLKRLDKIDRAAATLQQLWMSYNNVKTFAPLIACKRLRVLYAAHNNIDKLSEIDRLGQLPNLEDIVLIGNPIYNDLQKKGTYENEIIKRLKKLQVLDGKALTGLSNGDDDKGQGGGATTGNATGNATAQSGNASENPSRSQSPQPD